MTDLWPILAGLAVALAAFVGRWLHGRAVITAEQRGRLDALEAVRRSTEAAERDRAAALERIRTDVGDAVDGARASVPAGAVTSAEADAWAKPPRPIWWHHDPALAARLNAAQQVVYFTAPGTAERERAERALADLRAAQPSPHERAKAPKGPAS